MAKTRTYSAEEKQQILREVEKTGNMRAVALKHEIPVRG